MKAGIPPLRALHRWLAVLAALPLLVIFTSGILLSLSPRIEYLQPRSAPRAPGIELSFDRILEIARGVPEARISGWSDVAQIDARPAVGIVRVRADNYWEIQIDGHTGAVLKSAPRWKTLLVSLHSGSWFAPWAQAWVFFPAGLGAWLLWLTGLAIWARRFRATGKV